MKKDLFDALEGIWHLKRTCDGNDLMTGQAVFTRKSPSLHHYREDVLWQEDQQGFREYFYAWKEDTLQIFFSENEARGSLFLSLKQKQNYADQHFCGKDTYRAQFSFALPNAFSTRISVSGPRKGYVLETQYVQGIFLRS